ncbi:MAG: ctaD, partial [Nocardioides sp.]|nr:ctaD [Nocardioides sp.]
PWGWGRSLEWATSSPPPRHNFVTIPRIRSESPAFDLHHPEIALKEVEENPQEGSDQAVVDAPEAGGRAEHLQDQMGETAEPRAQHEPDETPAGGSRMRFSKRLLVILALFAVIGLTLLTLLLVAILNGGDTPGERPGTLPAHVVTASCWSVGATGPA